MPHATFLAIWGWSDTVFKTKSKGRAGFQSSPPVIFSLSLFLGFFPSVLSISVIETLKQMFLHAALLTRMFFYHYFPNILFSATLTGQKVNQAVIVTVEFVIYLICRASNTASKCVRFRGIHTYFTPFLTTFH